MELKQSYKVTTEEQIEFNQINSTLPFKTSTYINYDTNNNIAVVGEKVDTEKGGKTLKEPTGAVKAKFDALDDRTLKGCNWDKKS